MGATHVFIAPKNGLVSWHAHYCDNIKFCRCLANVYVSGVELQPEKKY